MKYLILFLFALTALACAKNNDVAPNQNRNEILSSKNSKVVGLGCVIKVIENGPRYSFQVDCAGMKRTCEGTESLRNALNEYRSALYNGSVENKLSSQEDAIDQGIVAAMRFVYDARAEITPACPQ